MCLDWILDIIFPRFCLGCGALGSYVCPKCEKTINFYDPQTCPYCEKPSPFGLTHPRCAQKFGLDGMFVLSHYDGLVKEIIHRVKYDGEYALLDDAAKLLVKSYHGKFLFDYFVPVPLSGKRERSRGFNQARKLAEQIINQINPIKQIKIADLIIRTRETKPQFGLKYDERKKNMKDAFALNSQLLTTDLKNYDFCLVDDVATTGATIFECAKVLKRAGAKNVYAICIARGG